MREKGARALEGRVDALRAGRGQRERPRMGRGGKDAWVPLGRLPILTGRVGCMLPSRVKSGLSPYGGQARLHFRAAPHGKPLVAAAGRRSALWPRGHRRDRPAGRA
eukprot:6856158-Pyramimonas_sp.AAC.1